MKIGANKATYMNINKVNDDYLWKKGVTKWLV